MKTLIHEIASHVGTSYIEIRKLNYISALKVFSELISNEDLYTPVENFTREGKLEVDLGKRNFKWEVQN